MARSPHATALLFPLMLVLALCLCDAPVAVANRRLDVMRALKAVRLHPQVQALNAPAKNAIESMVWFFLEESGDGTLLLPLDLIYFMNTMSTGTFDQVTTIKRYHIISGLFRWSQLRNLRLGKSLFTYVPDQNITKLTTRVAPYVSFFGHGGLPTTIVVPNLYLGETLIVHIITFALHPKL